MHPRTRRLARRRDLGLCRNADKRHGAHGVTRPTTRWLFITFSEICFGNHSSCYIGCVPRLETIPVALTIAGSDSGGGAGIQADLKTFASLGVHGTAALTCITAQNPSRVSAIQPCRPQIVREQMEAVFAELPPRAVKTGMLYSAEIIRVVAEYFKASCAIPLVVDPVMISTSGARLLKPSAVKLFKASLLPLAILVTPNLDEAAFLTGRDLKSVEDLRWAAKKIFQDFGCAAPGKGGTFAPFERGGGHFLRRRGGIAVERAVRPGNTHARHGLHLFGSDHGLPGAGLSAD